jgi:hypothetical protein
MHECPQQDHQERNVQLKEETAGKQQHETESTRNEGWMTSKSEGQA